MKYNARIVERQLQRRMEKRAAGWLPLFGDVANAAGSIASAASAYIIAAAILGGTGAGYVAAKTTAKGKQDIETAQKSYENERLKGDIGYLAARAQQEYDAQKRKNGSKEKSMMIR